MNDAPRDPDALRDPAMAPCDALAPTAVRAPDRWTIYAYLGGLIGLMTFCDPNGGLIDVPLSFILKNHLHLDARDLSHFRLIEGIPLYLSVCFGFIRDIWSPFGHGDRAYIVLFSLTSALIYAVAAISPVAPATLLAASILLTCASLFVASAQNGLASTIGLEHAMTGQISASWNISTALPAVVVFALGGYLSQSLRLGSVDTAVRHLFFIGAGLSLALAAFALLRPKRVTANLGPKRGSQSSPFADFKRLLRHRPIYPALLIWLLWNFSPGSATALQFYLQDTLGAGDEVWGVWNAIFVASFIPAYVLFGFLCSRTSLKALLWWGTVLAIPQFLPFLFVDSVNAALFIAVPVGLMGGVATAAYLDLIIRSAPRGLEGTMLMAASTMYFISTRFGDVLGSHVFAAFNNFGLCALMTTVCYLLILPILARLPDELTTRSARAAEPLRP